jgi:hypothetical protein
LNRAGEKKLAAAYKKAVADLPAIHPNIFEIRDGAKAFTDSYRMDAVKFLKKLAPILTRGRNNWSRSSDWLACRSMTRPLSEVKCRGRVRPSSKIRLSGYSFLPTGRSGDREAVVVDPQNIGKRGPFTPCLRALVIRIC